MITQEELVAALSYDPETGAFSWRERKDREKEWNKRWAGKDAGSFDRHGYKVIVLGYRSYKAHRLAWLYTYGSWPIGEIDHKNHIRSDNRISNLRDVPRAGNNQNRGKVRGVSKYMGVTYCKCTNKWRSILTVNGEVIRLGRFNSEEEARDAYLIAKGGLHEFFVPDDLE